VSEDKFVLTYNVRFPSETAKTKRAADGLPFALPEVEGINGYPARASLPSALDQNNTTVDPKRVDSNFSRGAIIAGRTSESSAAQK